MVPSRMALWMRGVGVGAIVSLSVMLAGCFVETADVVIDEEDVTETASELGETTAGDEIEGHTGEPQKDPDPVPWHFHVGRQGNPGPGPDDVRETIPQSPGHHDE